MSSKRSREIECLHTLFDKTGCKDEFVEYLQYNDILSKTPFTVHDKEYDQLNIIYNALQKGIEDNKVLLLDIAWTLLPVHQIKVHILTNRGSQDFLYGY